MRRPLNPWHAGGVLFSGLLLVPVVLLQGGVMQDGAPPSATEGLEAPSGTGELTPGLALAPLLPVLPEGPARSGRRGAEVFAPRDVPFPVEANGFEIRFGIQAVTLLPGEELQLVAPPEAWLMDMEGVIEPAAPGRWSWTAPRGPGVVPLRLQGPAGMVDLNVLVMRSMDEVVNGRLNGYRIGQYAGDPASPNPLHRPPVGFVEVYPEDEDILVTPHFTLGQFLCKDPGNPRYIVLSEALPVKLEAILEAVNEAGFHTPTLHVMSGYRTPAYNRAIGNTTDFSRHLWGDAADIFIDTTGNGMMDDLNGDGRVDDDDGRLLMRIVESVDRSGAPGVEPGGISLYRTIPGRGPFLHVDARGTPARW
jgi:hypothetical protein